MHLSRAFIRTGDQVLSSRADHRARHVGEDEWVNFPGLGASSKPPVIIRLAAKVHMLCPDIDRLCSYFYSGRLSVLELESGPGAGIGLGM